MEIKKLVNDEKYIIVPDTNVLLNLYRYSPDFSEFGLQCLTEVVESLYLPATVRLEFGKHCKAAFAAMEKKIENIGQGTEKQVKSARAKILSSCDQLKRLQFEGVDDLHRELAALLDALEVATKVFSRSEKGFNSAHITGTAQIRLWSWFRRLNRMIMCFPPPHRKKYSMVRRRTRSV